MFYKWKMRRFRKALDIYYSNEKAMLLDILLLKSIIKNNGLDLNEEYAKVLNTEGLLKKEYLYDGKMNI